MSAKKEKSKKVDNKTKSKSGFGLIKFFKETIIELKKVVWPTRRQLAVNTTIVIIASIITSIFIAGADKVFYYLDLLLFGK